MISKLKISPELLMSICVGLVEGEEIRYFNVAENGLPRGCKLIKATLDDNCVNLHIESSEFKEEELPAVILGVMDFPKSSVYPKHMQLAQLVADGNLNQSKVIALAKELCD